jgi:hypothetical protein
MIRVFILFCFSLLSFSVLVFFVALVQLLTIASNFGTQESAHQRFVGKFATPLGATLILFALTILLLGKLRSFKELPILQVLTKIFFLHRLS